MTTLKRARAAIIAAVLAFTALVVLQASPAHADWPHPGSSQCGMHWRYTVPSAGKIKLVTTYRCTKAHFAIRMGMTYGRSGRNLTHFNKECADSRKGVKSCTVTRTFKDPKGSQRWQVGVYRQIWRSPSVDSEVNNHWVVNFRH